MQLEKGHFYKWAQQNALPLPHETSEICSK